ncbi:MAG: VWA domain-containing protein [Lachnospiraceae bacterium]
MTLQYIWPLLFLLLIPALVALYILKQRAKTQPFSSNMLWSEVYKNIEAKTPFEKFQNQFLFYLQLFLLLLLIFALLSPALKNQKTAQEEVVFVLDTSASMRQKNGDKTRLEESIAQAKKELSNHANGTKYTIVTCDSTAAVAYQGTDVLTVKQRLGQVKASMESGNLDICAQAVQSLLPQKAAVKVCCYTDTAFDAKTLIKNHKNASLQVNSVYSQAENTAVSYLNYEWKDGQAQALCKVENFGKEASTQDISLYVDKQLKQVQTIKVKPQKAQTVYFDPVACDAEKNSVLKVQLSNSDALEEDNTQQTVVVPKQEKRILLISEGNVFLEKALTLSEQTKVVKTEDLSILESTKETYDLYVFDGQFLTQKQYDILPKTASILFVGDAGIEENAMFQGQKKEKNTTLTTEKTEVTDYMTNLSFGVTETNTYQLPDWGTCIFSTAAKKTAAFYGMFEQQQIAMIGFDLHNTDFALKAEYPIFMAQLGDVLLHTTGEIKTVENFPTAEESNVTAAENLTQNRDSKTAAKIGTYSLQKWILVLVMLLLIVEWVVYTRQIFSGKKRQYLVIRFLLLGVLVLAMADLTIPKKQAKNETIFLVDVSDSMKSNRDEMETYLKQTIDSMPKKNSCGVVLFGKDSQVEQFLTEEPNFYGLSTQPITTATNIEKAVQSAGSLFDEGVQKHLVLLTDGSENAGNMSLAAAGLKEADVSLSVLKYDDTISSNPEVYIDNVKVPDVIHTGDRYTVSVSMTSNVETNATLSLYFGRNLQEQKEVRLTKGENEFVFEETAADGSIANYKAVIEPAQDTVAVNNTYATFAQVETQPKILLIEGKTGETKEFQKVLDAANIGYDVVTPAGAPQKVRELTPYKAVVSVNVYYDDLRKGFAKALQSYVKDYAGGFVCIGGEDSYALGGYRDTEFEELLPVKMDLTGEKEIPKMAMALVMDHSGSMSSPADGGKSKMTNLDLAKQAADSALSELRKTDDIGVLAFDDTFNWLIPMQAAEDKDALSEKISTLNIGGGTSIYPAFQEAYEKMLKSNAKLKHIILLTDGEDEFKQYEDLINRINQAKITASTVAVGPESDQDTLQYIAEECGGRFYYTDAGTEVPRIFAQEVYLQTKSYRINEDFTPTITSTSLLPDSVQTQGLPMLRGYIATTAKQAADVVLTSDRDDPILSTWQYGLGKTVAWTSDALGNWSSTYANWEQAPQFWSQILHSVMADTNLGSDELSVEKENGIATLHYQTKQYDKNTEVTAVITDEEGKQKTVMLDAVKPGTFEKELQLDAVGIYQINLRKNKGEKVEKTYNTAFANQYSPEYQFYDNEKELEQFTAQAGGAFITTKDNIWKKAVKKQTTRVSITMPLLILALLFWMFDIAVRRLGLDVAGVILGVFEKLAKKAGLTIQKRRQHAETRRNEKKSHAAEMTAREQKIESKPVQKKQVKQTKKESEQTAGLDMQQLLQKKKERQ